ncbi:MAG: hypothetical protein WC861_00510 [Candidatus Micrarchaeia archaeon]
MVSLAFDFVALAGYMKAVAVLFATLAITFAGFSLATNMNPSEREEWKEVIAGALIGLVLLYLAPIIAAQLSGGSYCG